MKLDLHTNATVVDDAIVFVSVRPDHSKFSFGIACCILHVPWIVLINHVYLTNDC